MDINVIRIRSLLSNSRNNVIRENNDFLAEINNLLIDDDLLLVEGAKKAKYSIVFVETGGSEEQFVKLLPKLKEPIILLSNCKNNSLPAAMEIKTYCSKHEIGSLIISGDEQVCADLIKHVMNAAIAKSEIESSTLGVIGTPSDWLIASTLDYGKVNENLGINIIKIGMEELFNEINKKKYGKVSHLEEIKKQWKGDKNTLEEALNIYGALKRLVKKYNLSGLTVRCFDLLSKYKNTACLALALLNDEGIVSACEGDVPSLITMLFAKAISSRASFMANPSYINHEKKEILFAHCTIPFSLTSSFKLMTHFESNLGIGIQGEMNKENVCVIKLLFNNDSTLRGVTVLSGTIKENTHLKDYCRSQIMVEFNDYDFINFFKEDFGNHVIITYSDIQDVLYALMAMFKVKYEVL